MKKKPAAQSAFLNPRVLISFAFCAIGAVIALLAFALYPGGKALARTQPSELASRGVPVTSSALAHRSITGKRRRAKHEAR